MLENFLKGSKGWVTGAFGNSDDNGDGSSGGTARPYTFDKIANPLFILNEYGQTIKGTNKQLQGMKDMLHSLPTPSYGPEVFTPTPNYGIINQQYDDAEADLKNTPILGTDINQHIAQQQALGEQGTKLNHQRIQTLANMRGSALEQAAKDEYQNALSRHQTEEERRKFDMAIRQQIQDNEDAATAIKTDAAKKVGQEFYSLHKMKEMRQNAKALSDMQRDYAKNKQLRIDSEREDYDRILANDFRKQFADDFEKMQDADEFIAKYGITQEEYDSGLDSGVDVLYDTDAYRTKFDDYKTNNESNWVTRKNQALLDFDDEWWNANGDLYWSYKMKSGGKITREEKTTQDKILERLSKKNEKIAIDNNRALRDFVKQMNDKQTKIFLKLMS